MTRICHLHIGSPKTGSTTIQDWCSANKAALRDAGILYPGTFRRHNALLSAVHDDPSSLRFNRQGQNYDDLDVRGTALRDEFAEAQDTSIRHVIYSNENFLGKVQRIDLPRLRQLLDAQFDQVKVICYLRDPFKMLVSRAQEQVKSGVSTYEQVCARPPVLNIGGIDQFEKVFGRDALVLINFDDVVSRGALTASFLDAIEPGCAPDGLEEVTAKNASVSLEAAMILSGLNVEHSYHRKWSERFLKNTAVQDIGQTKFALPRKSVQKVQDKLMKQYDQLAALGLNFKVPDWKALPEATPNWSPKVMQQIAELLNAMALDILREEGKSSAYVVRSNKPVERD